MTVGLGRSRRGVRRRPMTMTLTSSFRRGAYAANAAAARVSAGRRRVYMRALVVTDLVLITAAMVSGYLARFHGSPTGTNIPYIPVGVGLVGLWMVTLAWS